MTSPAFRLERSQLIPRAVDEVFAFFSRAENLESLTPAFLHFQFVTPPPLRIRPGAVIEYRLRLCGLPFGWQTRIETFEPGRRFSDLQLRGPYAYWHHLHEFSPVPQGTLMRDVVDYDLPLGPVGRLAHPWLVRPLLRRIFDYRRDKIAALFGPSPAAARS